MTTLGLSRLKLWVRRDEHIVTAFVLLCPEPSSRRCDMSTASQSVTAHHLPAACALCLSSRRAPCRCGRDDITKQLMVNSLLDDLTGSMSSGADDAGATAQTHAIGSILAAVSTGNARGTGAVARGMWSSV